MTDFNISSSKVELGTLDTLNIAGLPLAVLVEQPERESQASIVISLPTGLLIAGMPVSYVIVGTSRPAGPFLSLQSSDSGGGGGSNIPTTGQIWPRGIL